MVSMESFKHVNSCKAASSDATINPVPKKGKVTELYDYRLVALTSFIMKCFERLVKNHITSSLADTLDSLQIAYHSDRSTALTHLD
jgi:hypothetical protein